jgi:hypothetical protein
VNFRLDCLSPPLGNFQLVSKPYSPKKCLTPWRGDVEIQGNRRSFTKFDDEGNPTNNDEGSKMGASNAPTLEDLMRRLEKLTAENKKPRAKISGKKTKGSSSSSEEEDSSFKEEVTKKGKKGRRDLDKASYNSMSSNYNDMPSSTTYTSIHVGKAPYFDGTSYNQ